MADIDLGEEGEMYRGKRSSRAAVFGDAPSSSGSEGDGPTSGDELEDEGPAAGAGAGKRKGASEPHRSAALGLDGWSDDDDGGVSDDSEDLAAGLGDADDSSGEAVSGSEDDASMSGDDDGDGDGDSDEDDMAKYTSGKSQEEGEVAKALGERARREREKGVAVRNQRELYDRALGMRILLQRAVEGANRLPRPEARRALERAGDATGDPSSAALLASLADEARDTLGALGELADALMSQQAALAGRVRKGAKRRADGAPALPAGAGDEYRRLWSAEEARHAALAGFRDDAVDRWYKKAVQGSGGGAMGTGQLKAIHQSVSQQVRRQMAEEGALARVRLQRAGFPGALGDPGRGPAGEGPAGEGAAGEGAAGEGAATEAMAGLDDRDWETFDDGEFYRTLLKEFLESGAARGAGGAAALQAQKKRKVVDRRASKGRKIRYQVIEKLVGFMAPVPMEELSLQARQLCNNLFGVGRVETFDV